MTGVQTCALPIYRFEVNIIPHTLEHTNMHDYRTGTRVNLEVDLIARYLERLLSAHTPAK